MAEGQFSPIFFELGTATDNFRLTPAVDGGALEIVHDFPEE